MAVWLAQLIECLERDHLIDEYALVPRVTADLFGLGGGDSEEDLGCCVADHKLALSVEVALVVYRHAAKGMTVSRLVDSWEEVDRTSRAVLLCGAADSASAWSCRRELLRKAFLNIDMELHFNAMLLRTHHKSSEAWAFRRHLLNTLAPSELVKLAATEVCLVEELTKKYDHHYYAWNHWSWLSQCYLGVSNGDVLPNLSVMTPSHYGLFHHRIMNVLSELRGLGLPISKRPEPHEGSVHANVDASAAWASGALPFSTKALAAFESERRLSSSLLSTFPHLEAPWLFRLNLFAALLEAMYDCCGSSGDQLHAILDLWRCDMNFATSMMSNNLGSVHDEAVSRSFSLRFRFQLLQEVASFMRSLHHVGGRVSVLCATFGVEARLFVKGCEAEEAVPPSVLRWIQMDLESLGEEQM
mmetsp:Transcript_36205/g.96176  ORF Transcript_36205/g.96176 Transcript_36205/m.96176 type:complete len:414 (-) Transcript_36205:346-1587(-)